jgi:hypothetical protein
MALIRYAVKPLALTLNHPLKCRFIYNLNPQIFCLKAVMLEGWKANALLSYLPSSLLASEPPGFIAFCFTRITL